MVFDYDLEIPVRALIRPTVVGHRIVRLQGESTSKQRAIACSRAETIARSESQSSSYTYATGETVGESEGTSTSESLSDTWGTSNAEMSGFSHGESVASMPGTDFFAGPVAIGTSQSEGVHQARSRGKQENHSRSAGNARSRNSSRSQSTSEAWSEGRSSSTSNAVSVGVSISEGTSATAGWRETFEPIPTGAKRHGLLGRLSFHRNLAVRTVADMSQDAKIGWLSLTPLLCNNLSDRLGKLRSRRGQLCTGFLVDTGASCE